MYLSVAETEVVQGLPQDVTNGLGFARPQRIDIIGNSLGSWMMQAILIHYVYPATRRASSDRYLAVFHSTVPTQPETYPATPQGAATYVELLASFDGDYLLITFAPISTPNSKIFLCLNWCLNSA